MNDIANCSQANDLDTMGNPTGGSVEGIGIKINWQQGPLGRGDDRQTANGAFVETVISAAKQRLEFFQTTKFRSEYNARAIVALTEALQALEQRTADREKREVEGTHTI